MTFPIIKEITAPTAKSDLALWLRDQAGGSRYLLAHTDAGIIWGRVNDPDTNPNILTSADVFGARLGKARLELYLLWELRLFGPNAEVHLWRSGDAWQARCIEDGGAVNDQVLEERHILWGDQAEARDQGFTLLVDGSEGLRHAVPLDVPDTAFEQKRHQERKPRPLRLVMRHYLEHDHYGNARIALSRLVDLEVK